LSQWSVWQAVMRWPWRSRLMHKALIPDDLIPNIATLSGSVYTAVYCTKKFTVHSAILVYILVQRLQTLVWNGAVYCTKSPQPIPQSMPLSWSIFQSSNLRHPLLLPLKHYCCLYLVVFTQNGGPLLTRICLASANFCLWPWSTLLSGEKKQWYWVTLMILLLYCALDCSSIPFHSTPFCEIVSTAFLFFYFF